MGPQPPSAVRALALIWSLLLAVPAGAQFRPPGPGPAPPTPGQPGPLPSDPETQDETASGRTGGWDPIIVIEGAWEENVGFTTPPGPDAYFGSIRASLSRWRRTSRSNFRLNLDGAGYAYREQDSRNRADGAASVQYSSQLSRHVSGGLRGGFAYEHTDSQAWLIDNAVLYPLVRTLSGTAGAELSWQLAERTDLSVAGDWRRIDFDSDLLLDTEAWSTSVVLTQRVSRRQELSLRLRGARVDEDVALSYYGSASLGYSYRFARNFSLDLSAGAGGSETVSGVALNPDGWDVAASAGISGTVRGGYFSLGYSHGLRPRPGLAITELTDLVTISAVLPVGRRLELIARGSFALRGQGGDGALRRSRDGDAFGGAALRVARRLRIVLGYRFRYRDNALEGPEIKNNRASVSLAWGPTSLVEVR